MINKLNYNGKKIPYDYYGFVYKTIFPNGKIYIGQTTLRVNITYFGSGGNYFRNAIEKYGKGGLKREILKFAKSQKQLDNWEFILIKNLKSCDSKIGYNILSGTANKFGSINPSKIPEVAARISQTKKANSLKNPDLNLENSKRQKEYFIKNPHKRDEIRKERIEYYKNNPEMREQIRNKNLGKKHSEETKNKIGDSFKNRVWITNGVSCNMIFKSEGIPQGYRLGRIIKKKINV